MIPGKVGGKVEKTHLRGFLSVKIGMRKESPLTFCHNILWKEVRTKNQVLALKDIRK